MEIFNVDFRWYALLIYSYSKFGLSVISNESLPSLLRGPIGFKAYAASANTSFGVAVKELDFMVSYSCDFSLLG